MSLPTDDSLRLAAIDVGSNSIKMLAADVSAASIARLVARASRTVRLESGLESGALSESALADAEESIAVLARMAREAGAARVEAFGTSALRDAANGAELARRVLARCGVVLRVISGREEAESAYIAAASSGRELVVNPGGGSTEMALGESGTLLSARSAHIGAVSLKRAAGESAASAVAMAERILRPEWERVNARPGDALVASGGTATCAAAVLLGMEEYDARAIEGFSLRAEEAEALMERLFAMPLEERCRIPGLPPRRADILPCGLAILTAFFRMSGFPRARVTDRGNLYGFLRRMYARPDG